MPEDDGSMRNSRPDLRPVLIIVLAVVLLAACSNLSRKISKTDDLAAMMEARRVLLALSSQNEKLINFKGIGKIKVWHSGKKKIDEKVAWIGSETFKISIVVLISGYPAIKIASDGKWVYYYETRKEEPLYIKYPATDATLQRIVSVPIKISDIISLLAGRTPFREHHSALLQRQDSGNGYVLTLKKRWYGVVEKIYLAEDKRQVSQIEFFNRSGSLIYRARLDEMQTVNTYQIPTKLSISSDTSMGFQLVVQKYWTGIPVFPSMFVLRPPN
ncbi:MAG: DUF4292 domain-containing protein [Desulfobacterales bacterium]